MKNTNEYPNEKLLTHLDCVRGNIKVEMACRDEINTRLHNGRIALALLFATAISPNNPTCFPAEWLSEDENKFPLDLQLGTHNDWWLREDDGSLYIQARHRSGDYAKCILARMEQIASIYENTTGIKVRVPVGK